MQINGIRADLIKHGVVRERKESTEKDTTRKSIFQTMLADGEHAEVTHKNAVEAAATASVKSGREAESTAAAEYAALRVTGGTLPPALKKAEWRGIGYEQSDLLRIDVLGGYTLKAKINKADRGIAPSVYVEAKYDDGRQEAYILESSEVTSRSKSPVEAIAYEALFGKREEKNI